MADQTSSLPSIEAVTRSLPSFSMCRKEFSSTTIDASTTMPMPRASPPNVMVFSVKPAKYSRAKVPMTEIGIDVQTMSVDRKLCRNSEDDQDDQDRADERVLLHRGHRALDEHRAVVEHRQLDARHLAIDPSQPPP